ncbi:hypothetical protein OZX56_00810 [Lactobacillus sp. ESL0684]|uniref:hypothetical protein n=1 Tax=unclassified Lactobacillus TaxID=2620435 RepID=UPI0023F80181|nr:MULTISPECIES: hypothetical protein [unclassified Lactobacillus]WEV39659.1 hypothetical protein OZX59_05430 [Lactobacillus sp. ESL0681]WEV43810.1 hypothetical protein OZX56_00810 [Lactobacillus sp. ESL0684]
MTEKEKNTKDNEETIDLEVVVPQANWKTMPQEEFTSQPDYLQIFADFYIAQFNERDLEIMDAYDTDANMVDINHYIIDNINFSRRELVKHVLQYHGQNFQNLVDEIVKQDNIAPTEMTTYQDWENWYEDRRSHITNSLS